MSAAAAQHAFDIDRVKAADRAEALAWADLFAAAPPPMGLKTRPVGDGTALIAPPIPLGLFNRVIGLGFDGPVAAAALDEIAGLYAGKFFVHVGPATDAYVAAGLAARGYTDADPVFWAKMVHDGRTPERPTALTVRPVTRGDDLAAFATVIRIAHGMPPVMDPWIMALVGRQDWFAYGAFDGSTVVAGAMLWRRGADAWLGMAGTLPEARGRGAQGALLARRVRDAFDAGATTVTTETWVPAPGGHNTSLANMARAGFTEVCRRRNLTLAR